MVVHIWLLLARLLVLVCPALSDTLDDAKYNNPTAGPPASYFAAATTVPIAALKSAAAKANTAATNATYPVNASKGAERSTIHSDWIGFSEGAAFVWIADMDVDCDGIDYKCKGNPDGQSLTNFGALAAYEVPFIVIPHTFATTYKSDLPGDNIAAVICNDKMLYGIYGDSDGDDPEVIGEASWLMARTCFPNDNLNGNSGHENSDVAYILFIGKDAVLPSHALNRNYVTNFGTLRSMGDKLITALANNLEIDAVDSNGTATTTSSGPESTGSCAWQGHCAGATCDSADDCSDSLVCKDGRCTSETKSDSYSWVNHCTNREAVVSKVLFQALIFYCAQNILLVW